MNLVTFLDFVNVFCAGILAGTLVVIDYGVGPAIAAVLDEQSQIQIRQALIRGLRVMVPIIFVLTILTGIAITVLNGFDAGFAFRLVGLIVVIISFLFTLIGTAPINATVLTWQLGAPPQHWRTLISRWERLDKARTWAAITAFALFLTAIAFKLTAH